MVRMSHACDSCGEYLSDDPGDDCDHEDDHSPDGEHDNYGDLEDDRSMFADPGGNSALRAATANNPRNLPCPSCGTPDVLTPADRALGYQCNACADQAERGY